MSNHTNHKRGEQHRTENGPRWENGNPGAGCNSTHVAKARADWKKIKNRSLRRTGRVCPNYHKYGPVMCRELPSVEYDE